MKFVHVTSQRNISRIKKNGIRKGRGRRGNGVYAIPLMHIDTTDYSDYVNDHYIHGHQISTSKAWKGRLFKRTRANGGIYKKNKPAAIVFNLPDNLWPIRLYFLMETKIAIDILASSAKTNSKCFSLLNEDLEYLELCRYSHLGDVGLTVHSAKCLGKFLNQYFSMGGTISNCGNIEVVISKPISPSCIERIVPMYQSNKKCKSKKGRLRNSDCNALD